MSVLAGVGLVSTAQASYITDQSYGIIYSVEKVGYFRLVGMESKLSGTVGIWAQVALHDPSGITLDHKGNLYIADRGNSIIRKVNLRSEYVTTVAGNRTSGFSGDGGLATEAQLNEPEAVVVDSSGNLYIADSKNYRIRQVDHATGIISTVLGGEAS